MCCINVRTQWKSRTKCSIRKTHYTYTEHMKCYTVESHICDWTWCQLLHFAIVGQYSQWRDVEQRGPPVLLLQQLKHIIYLAVSLLSFSTFWNVQLTGIRLIGQNGGESERQERVERAVSCVGWIDGSVPHLVSWSGWWTEAFID